jgi:hypothetical protein
MDVELPALYFVINAIGMPLTRSGKHGVTQRKRRQKRYGDTNEISDEQAYSWPKPTVSLQPASLDKRCHKNEK